MEPTLHMKQGQNLLERVMKFYPMMKEGNSSTVTLTDQDWLVLMDFVENPQAKEHWPENVESMTVDRNARTIHVKVPDCDVAVTMGF